MIRHVLLVTLLAFYAAVPVAAQTCRHALALGLDVSGSVDAREYRLQIDGLALALNSAAVRAAVLERTEAPVTLLIFEWSGPQDQSTLVPWTPITDADALNGIIARLADVERRADATPGTALGMAMLHGAQLLAQRGHCWRRTLDISGDGTNNLGPRPHSVKPQLVAQGITINALVIDADTPAGGALRQSDIAQLSAYFTAEVILGPDAFVQVASGFEDYATAMEVKLLRELDGLVVSLR